MKNTPTEVSRRRNDEIRARKGGSFVKSNPGVHGSYSTLNKGNARDRTRDANTAQLTKRQDLDTAVRCTKCHKFFNFSQSRPKPAYNIIIENAAERKHNFGINQGAKRALLFEKLQKRNKKTLLRNLKLMKGKCERGDKYSYPEPAIS